MKIQVAVLFIVTTCY